MDTVSRKLFITFVYVLITISLLYYFTNYDFNYLINTTNSFLNRECINEIHLVDQSQYYKNFLLQSDFSCIEKVVRVDYAKNIIYIAKLSEGYLLVLKALTIYLYLIITFLFLVFLLKKEKLFKNILNSKFNFLLLFFINFVFLRYLFITFKDKSYITSASVTKFEFVMINLIYILIVLLICYLVSRLNNNKLLFVLLTVFFTLPLFNFLGLYSNLFIALIFPSSLIIFKIINSNTFVPVNTLLIVLISIQTFQILINLSEAHNGESFITQIQSSLLEDSGEVENSNIFDNSLFEETYPPIIIFWFDELPANTVFSNSNVREEYPNLKSLSNMSYNFYNNVSLSGYSPYAIYEVFNDNLIKDVSKNYNFGTVEKSTNICNFKFCDFKLVRYKTSDNFTYLSDVLAIYLNLYSLEFFQDFVPDISTKSNNFLAEKYRTPTTFSEDSQLYTSYKSSEFLTENAKENSFIFSHILLPHMPWRYSKDGTYYYSGESVLTSIFLENIRNESFLSWNNDYKSNSYYQKVEASRLVEQTIFMDSLLGDLVVKLKENGRFDESLIIFTSDHGINFNSIKNSRAASDENLLVYNTPLIIKLPYQSENYDVSKFTSHELISELIVGVNENGDLENIISQHTPSFRVKVFNDRDKFKETDAGYATINSEQLEYEIQEDAIFFNSVYEFYSNNYGWIEKDINLKDLVEVSKDVTIKSPIVVNESELKFKYIVFETKLNIRNLIIKNGSKILEIPYFAQDNSEYLFYLDTALTSEELKKLKFYIEK